MAEVKEKATKEDEALALPKFVIKKATAVQEPKSITIYGRPKIGKTILAASIVDAGFERVLLIDVEGGASAVAGWGFDIDVIEAGTAKEFNRVANAVLNGELLHESGKPYQVVIIDTLDKAQERQLEVFANSPESKTKQGDENKFYKWEAIGLWTTKVGDAFHMAPFLSIFLLHEEDDKNEETGAVMTLPMLKGKSKHTFGTISDIIGRYEARAVKVDGKSEQHRVLSLALSSKTITGQRFAQKLDGDILDPTMEAIYSRIRAK